MVGLIRPWITRGSLRHLLALAVVVLGACGIGFWLLEPKAVSLADGLWLAFTTAATVGYGDIVPTTTASKIFSVFVVLLGYAALSLVTAAIAAMWVETTERQVERDILNELHREVKALRAEIEQLRADRKP
ncbi:ion transporter [Inhella sp. 4Y17]|uniref:Ion transporter n=2 Tax=Inhella gelatinilytica TaxID=2795030 RepID=A0A931N9F2_9BURK|nr:ion transporter [Inhella gelatinilytica]